MSNNPLAMGLDPVASVVGTFDVGADAGPSATPGPVGTGPSSADGPPPLLLSAADIARELRCSAKTVARMDASGKLPRPITIGYRAKRWPREELVRWIAAGAPARGEWERLRCQPTVGRRSR